MRGFVGRSGQLTALDGLLTRVRADAAGKPGKALLIRGRRRVGKSRLVEEFVERAAVPSVYFTASTRSTGEELRLFAEEVSRSDLPGAALFVDVTLTSWDAAFRLLASAVPTDGPCVVVLDELPYLTASDPGFEGTLQKAFDRELSRHRVLLIGVGSDVDMMEALNEYGRPFHQRATEMVVPALSPAEVGTMLGLGAADAFDAYLVNGGLPLICEEWPLGATLWDYLAAATNSPTSALLVSAERALAAEFPTEVQARDVLGAIGSGERSHANIARAAADTSSASLSRALILLAQKRVVAAERPLSIKPSRETRYRVADPYLRFWLAFLGTSIPEVERGRGDRVFARIQQAWPSWRGRAIEPVLREALDRMPTETFNAGTVNQPVIGAFWTRTNDPEIDVVVADRAPVAKAVFAVGSIKWREQSAFDARDHGELLHHRGQLPGATEATQLFAVSRSGCSVSGLRVFEPAELIDAWHD